MEQAPSPAPLTAAHPRCVRLARTRGKPGGCAVGLCCFLGAFYLQRQLLQRQQASSALPTCVLHPQWEWETKVEWTRGLASHPSNRLLSQPSPRALTPTLLSEPRSAACRVFPSRSSLSAHRRRGHGGLRWTLLESAPDLRGPSQAIGWFFSFPFIPRNRGSSVSMPPKPMYDF